MHHIIEMTLGNLLFLIIFILKHEFDNIEISRCKQQQTLRGQSIPPGPSDLLIVAFNVFGNGKMDNKTNIGFVDAHAESYCGHNDLNVIPCKTLLVLISLKGIHTCMVWFSRKPCLFQSLGHAVHLVSGGTVDNTSLPFKLIDAIHDLLKGINFCFDL